MFTICLTQLELHLITTSLSALCEILEKHSEYTTDIKLRAVVRCYDDLLNVLIPFDPTDPV